MNIAGTQQPLFTPVRMGKLELPNRIVMAPLTRMRAANSGHAPTELHAEYYAQRASAGLIIGECTEISPDAYGWADTPGLWSAEQVRGWRGVTQAVHKKGGLMYAQLWHTGAMSHPDFFDGALPMSASNVNPEQESVTPSGRKPTAAPRPMSKEEIRQTVTDFGTAGKNAMEAGFDGVQIQANYLYLIAQFLNSATNLRKDEYGGSTVNRARFLFEITEAVLAHVEPGRVGIKIGPMNIPSLTPGYRPRDGSKAEVSGPFAANADTLPDMEYVIKRLNDYNLSHLLLMGANTDFTGSPLEQLAGDGMFQHFRTLFHGHLIANVEMTQERGNRLIETGLADSIAFGRPYIANSDLPERFGAGAPLAEVDWNTVYAAGPEGYTEYPALEAVLDSTPSTRNSKRNMITAKTTPEQNKALVLEAFDTLFNQRDYAAAERYWSPHYIQHSAHISPGRDGLFDLIKSMPPTLKYEPGVILAEGDLVIVHGRFSGFGAPSNWIAADIVRIKNGILVEHWDVIQDEATKEQSKSGNPMFGDAFPIPA